MSWLALLPAALLAALLLFGLGVPVLLAAGIRGFPVAALAPATSLTIIAVTAILTTPLGLPWTWITPAVVALLLTVALWFVVRRWGLLRRFDGVLGARTPDRWLGMDSLWTLVSFVVAALLMTRHFVRIFGRPDAISQTYDNIFHLSATRYIVDTNNASTLTLSAMSAGPGESTLYPAAFHDTVSLVLRAMPESLPLAMNGVLYVIVALVWPLACIFFVRSVMAPKAATLVAAGILSASFTAFPIGLLDFGVLYPNLLGLALLPAALGLVVQLMGLATVPRFTLGEVLFLGLVTVPGMLLSHPNVFMTLCLMVIPFVVTRLYRQFRAGRRGEIPWRTAAWQVAGLAAILLVILALWPIVRPPASAATWPPFHTTQAALGQAILNAPMENTPAWFVSVLMCIGAWAALVHKRAWLFWSWAGVTLLWVIIASFGMSPLRMFLTGIWYNDSHRYAAFLVFISLPLATLGFGWLQRALDMVWAGLARRWGRPSARAHLAVSRLIGVGLLGVLLVMTQPANYLDRAVERAAAQYVLDDDSLVVDADEMKLLERLREHVPDGAVVATEPGNGSSLAYALTGVKTTTRHILYMPSPPLRIVNARLDTAGIDPTVCPAVRELGITHVLDFRYPVGRFQRIRDAGFSDLAWMPGFRLVDSEGDAALYEVTACG